MPISQSLYTGITGLSINSDGMSVVANNIANANSKGFKKDRAEFEDLLSVDLSTGAGSAQIGRGGRLKDVRTMHTQGSLAVTDNLTDLAVQGMGFFVVSNPKTETMESAGKFYTRIGSFVFDKDGYLADGAGGRVQGYLADPDGNIATRLTDVRVETNIIPPSRTNEVKLDLNLDSRSKVLQEPFDVNKAEQTSNFSNTITIYDSQGASHQMTVFFKRLEDSDGISWKWHAAVDGSEVLESNGSKMVEIGTGTVKFDSNGNLLEEIQEEFEVNFAGGAAPNQKINIDFGTNRNSEGGNGVGGSKSIASKSVINLHSQNGYEAGNIKSLRIDLDGTLVGVFTNGIVRPLGALALATFENQDGLMKAGHNHFYATTESGPAKIGMAQTGSRGSVYASSLEESNVDLAQEFVNMIMTQRGFQANSRSITTTDSMYEEVINLKR
jgi:flagellar hook protein FlgE